MPRKLKSKSKKPNPEEILTITEKLLFFLAVHWRGLLIILVPVIAYFIAPWPGHKPMSWVAFTLFVMAAYWVTECIPVPVTSFLPFVCFPLTNVMNSSLVSKSFINDTVTLFLGSIYLAYSVEQSGCHRRIAYFAISKIGYSHVKLLGSLCIITTFISLFISNTAATTVMVPINFAILRVFEENQVLSVFERNAQGELQSSDITAAYFCTAAYCATIGGIGTLIATGTNLVFKGLFMAEYPTAPEYLSFPKFSQFTLPMMAFLVIYLYLWMAVMYLGLFRPSSKAGKRSYISKEAQEAARIAIEKKYKRLGSLKFHEVMVVTLFGGAMAMFFCRSPQIFKGWGDLIVEYFGLSEMKFVKDSAVSLLSTFLMILVPNKLIYARYFKEKYIEDLPKKPANSVLNWALVNKELPYSFMFLIGGGFALSTAARITGLNGAVAGSMTILEGLSTPLVLFILICMVILVTNFASNIAVANVFVPISISLAKKLNANPLWFCIVAGLTASMTFMMPVATPGNLIVQQAAKIPVYKMVEAGAGLSLGTIFLTYAFYLWYCPVVWPVVLQNPEWMGLPPPADVGGD